MVKTSARQRSRVTWHCRVPRCAGHGVAVDGAWTPPTIHFGKSKRGVLPTGRLKSLTQSGDMLNAIQCIQIASGVAYLHSIEMVGFFLFIERLAEN